MIPPEIVRISEKHADDWRFTSARMNEFSELLLPMTSLYFLPKSSESPRNADDRRFANVIEDELRTFAAIDITMIPSEIVRISEKCRRLAIYECTNEGISELLLPMTSLRFLPKWSESPKNADDWRFASAVTDDLRAFAVNGISIFPQKSPESPKNADDWRCTNVGPPLCLSFRISDHREATKLWGHAFWMSGLDMRKSGSSPVKAECHRSHTKFSTTLMNYSSM